MGSVYELGKKRKGAIDALKALSPEKVDDHDIDIPMLEAGLKDAARVGAAQFKMPGDHGFGTRIVLFAEWKLKRAKKVQLGEGGVVSASPPEFNADEDFSQAAKLIAQELQEAEAAGDDNKVKMLTLVQLDQLDSWRADKKLLGPAGKIEDLTRGLFMICEAKGILHAYYRVSRSFARRVVKPNHSVPYYRLMVYGWQPTVNHFDFAGILNANAVYSFTVGLPQLVFSVAFIIADRTTGRVVAPCETDDSLQCNLVEDFKRPNVQMMVLLGSLSINVVSIMISVSNIIIDFPAQIFKIVEKEEEVMFMTLQAESATKMWEDKLATEVQEKVKNMLKVSTIFDSNQIKGMEAPRLVIDDVIKLEKQAMAKKTRYLEFFMNKQKQEMKARNRAKKAAAREAKRQKAEEEAQRKAAAAAAK